MQASQPDVTWKGDRNVDKPKGKDKMVFTAMWFFINTNKAFRTDGERSDFEARFKSFLYECFDSTFLQQNVFYDRHTNKACDKIIAIKTKIAKEYGAKDHRLHCNVHISIQHQSNIGYDLTAIKDLYFTRFGYNCFVSKPHFYFDSNAWQEWYDALND